MKRVFWTIPKIWHNATCYMLGGGPGLNLVDLTRLAGAHVIAINDAYQLGPWDAVFFGDEEWYRRHEMPLRRFSGLKVTNHPRVLNEPGIKTVRRCDAPYGISRKSSELCWNLNSGAGAIGLAVHLGAKRIVLLGYDMRKIGQDHNWHRGHPDWNSPKKNPYEKHLRVFPDIAADLQAMGVECVNATPGSAMTVFPIVDPETVLPSAANKETHNGTQ